MKKLVLFFLFIGMMGFTNAQWMQTSLDSDRVQCLAVKGDSIFAGTVNNGVLRSTDNGGIWNQMNTGFNGYLNIAALAIKGNNVFAGNYDIGIFKSSIYGNNWTSINTGLANFCILALAIDNNNLFAGTFGGGIYSSQNDGNSWDSINTGLANRRILSIAAKGDSIFLGTYGNVGSLFFSTNYGIGWDSANVGLPVGIWVNAIIIKGDTVYAADWSCTGVFRSTNYGQSWVAVNNGLPSLALYDFSLVVRGNVIFLGSAEGVFLTADNANNWVSFNEGLPPQTLVHALAYNSNYIFAATNNNGVWRRPISDIADIAVININESSVNVYPNPATNTLTIETPTESTIQILFTHGQLIKTLIASGDKTIVDVSALPAGMYIVQVKTEKGVGVGKFVKE